MVHQQVALCFGVDKKLLLYVFFLGLQFLIICLLHVWFKFMLISSNYIFGFEDLKTSHFGFHSQSKIINSS